MPFAIDLKFIYEPLTTNEEVAKPNTHTYIQATERKNRLFAMPCLRMQWMTNGKRKSK